MNSCTKPSHVGLDILAECLRNWNWVKFPKNTSVTEVVFSEITSSPHAGAAQGRRLSERGGCPARTFEKVRDKGRELKSNAKCRSGDQKRRAIVNHKSEGRLGASGG